MLGNIAADLAKMMKTQETQKKLVEGLVKGSKGDKELDGLVKNMQKLMNEQKKVLQAIEKKSKKGK